jgi:uncharacterized membrane protein YjjP (DUF1212 family)
MPNANSSYDVQLAASAAFDWLPPVCRRCVLRTTNHTMMRNHDDTELKNGAKPVLIEGQELDRIAEVTSSAARMLMEVGVRAKVVHEDCARIAHGLGAERVDLCLDYASLDITVTRGRSSVTKTVELGPLGVNYRLSHAIRGLAQRICRGGMTPAEAQSEMMRVKQGTGDHPSWVVALGVGIACAAFGRLLGMDWASFLPVFASGAIGQSIRYFLFRRGTNVFVVAACVAFLASSIGGLGAQWAGSTTFNIAMIASVLLLVPGVPALDAQYDILDGYPTLGTARAVVVSMILIFTTTGVLIARAVLGGRQ